MCAGGLACARLTDVRVGLLKQLDNFRKASFSRGAEHRQHARGDCPPLAVEADEVGRPQLRAAGRSDTTSESNKFPRALVQNAKVDI